MRTYDITRVSYDTKLGYAWQLTLREGTNTRTQYLYTYEKAEAEGKAFSQFKYYYTHDMFKLTDEERILKERHQQRIAAGVYN
jgi:hypothetical protein